MADREPLEVIKQGAEAWNVWRAEHRDVQLDLQRAELRSLDLRGVDLREADLRAADFRGAFLGGTNLLVWPTLRNADLTGANCRGVSLVETDCAGTVLKDVDFSGVFLKAAKNPSVNQFDGVTIDQSTVLPDGIDLGAPTG